MLRALGRSLALAGTALLAGCGGQSAVASTPTADDAPAPAWLDSKQVVFAMRGSEEEYRKCFMRAITSRGYVQTRFRVDPEGSVHDVEIVRSTIGHGHVEECLKNHLRSQRFGEVSGAQLGKWTFVFRLSEPIADKDFKRKLAQARSRETDGGVQLGPDSIGRIDPAAVEDIAMAGYPLFAGCYRDSIQRRTVAGGVLKLRFVIDESGFVSDVADAGTVLPDPFAVDCIAEGFFAMNFPSPEGGPVEASFRLDFE